MDSRFTEAQAKELAQIEEEAGGVISAGADLGDRLGEILRLELFESDSAKLVALVSARFGGVLSQQEVEELVAGFQGKVQEKVTEKLAPRKSA
ncbi:hypothetical protein ACKFKG_17545 [Phormidesmis sp. 146-35]